MTDREMLELCAQHFAFLGKAAGVTKLKKVGTKQFVSSRAVIQAEAAGAIQSIRAHLDSTALARVTPDPQP